MTSFIDYANSFGSEFSEIPFLIREISNRSELDSDRKKKHMLHSVVLRMGEDRVLMEKSVLELYLFDREGFKNLRYLNYGIPLTRSSLAYFRLREHICEVKLLLFREISESINNWISGVTNLEIKSEDYSTEASKIFDEEAIRLFKRTGVMVRKPEDYSAEQRLDIVAELNNILNPFSFK